MQLTRIDKYSAWLSVVGFILIFLFLLLLLFLLGTYLPLIAGLEPWSFFRVPAEFFLGLLNVELPESATAQNAAPASYVQVISAAFMMTLVIFTFLLATVPLVDKFRYRSRLRNQSIEYEEQLRQDRVYEIVEITEKGGGIATLEQLVKNCEKTIIFAGSFKWLYDRENFKSLVTVLAKAKKITIVSCDSKDEVRASLGQDDDFCKLLMSRAVCLNNRAQGMKTLFTFVWFKNQTACCTLVEHSPGSRGGKNDTNIIVRSEKPDGKVLLDIFEKLSNANKLMNKAGK